MQFDIGTIHIGKVTGITGYGAFVTFEGGSSGMLHISEISEKFVKDITEYLRVGDEVKVMIINVDERGKLALSIRRLNENSVQDTEKRQEQTAERNPKPQIGERIQKKERRVPDAPKFDRPPEEFVSSRKTGGDFEDMMSRFRHDSDEKISDLKKAYDSKRGAAPKQRKRY